MAELEIIKLDDGFATVKREGIDPFINCIENNEREFFRAKEFVKLYDLIFKMSATSRARALISTSTPH